MAWLRGHWQLLALTALIVALWQTPVVIPLKILIVFLHELSHALTTILTGGEVVSLTVDPMQGGAVLSRGGSRFLTLSAGYVGSLLIGVVCLLLAIRTTWDRAAVAFLGLTMIAVAVLYGEGLFALGFTAGVGAAFLLTARFLPHEVSDLILRVVGLASMIYVPFDIISDTITRAHLRSDARMLAEEFAGTTMMWGGVWLILSLVVIGLSLRHGLGRDSNLFHRGPDRN